MSTSLWERIRGPEKPEPGEGASPAAAPAVATEVGGAPQVWTGGDLPLTVQRPTVDPDKPAPSQVRAVVPSRKHFGQVVVGVGFPRQLIVESRELLAGVAVKANPTNTSNVYVGGANVNAAGGASGTGWVLAPGDEHFFVVSDLSLLWVIGTTATDWVCYEGG